MPTQAEIRSGYDTALRSYYNWCATRGIQPDQTYINNLLMTYGFPPQAQTLPRTDIIQAETESQISQNEIAEDARQFDITNAATIDQAAKDRASAEKRQSIASAAMVEAARVGNEGAFAQARADVEAAQIDAAAAIETANIAAAASRYSDDIKAEIATEQRKLDREKYMAVELARPGNWVERVGFYRGQTPEQAAELAKYAGSTVYGGQVGGLPQAQPATAGAAPVAAQAVVGEQGPELATATPQGTQITPLQADQARYLRGQLPQMAYGGVVSGPGAGGRVVTSATPTYKFPATRNTGAVRSELLNPSQMLETMVGRSRTPDEYLQRQETGLRFLGGQLPQTGATTGGTGATHPIVGPGGTQPAGDTGEPAGSPINDLTIFQAARAGGQYGLPPFQAWTGPTRNTVTGVEIPPPWQINLQQFSNMSRAEQAMMAGHWRSMGMIPGETEEEMLANAYDAMRRSAFTGMASALPQYAGMR